MTRAPTCPWFFTTSAPALGPERHIVVATPSDHRQGTSTHNYQLFPTPESSIESELHTRYFPHGVISTGSATRSGLRLYNVYQINSNCTMSLSTEKLSDMKFENPNLEEEDMAGGGRHSANLTRKVLWKLDSRLVKHQLLILNSISQQTQSV